ncbi:DUF6796 family protein [Caulobacter sp. BE254]|uniref:DUF6796 family protein n=1 Tax=Caulobacter sp. BE254 TaxID=2817720 RepID=UPI002863DDD3|nr:DUF6796 family protein [Caulobacter sp. BE254]MDR7116763.1 hypothetical protein [Caulobacter sp. BE254]
MTNPFARFFGYAGLIGACAMFAGDMLFYGQWGSGADALTTSLDVVRRTDPQRLAFGGFASIIGGLGYALGAGHVYARTADRPAWLRQAVAGSMLILAIIATATHAVWGSFALTMALNGPSNALVANYLSTYFLMGGVVGAPASLLLAAAILTRRTRWPMWFALVNPGLFYLLLSNATYLPAPLGAPIVGGAFNIAFALFYAFSVAHSMVRSNS